MKNQTLSFEESIEKLEAAVKKLEGGSLSLDESLAVFEEAIGLVRSCNEKLEGAKQKVSILTETQEGAVTAPFAVGEE